MQHGSYEWCTQMVFKCIKITTQNKRKKCIFWGLLMFLVCFLKHTKNTKIVDKCGNEVKQRTNSLTLLFLLLCSSCSFYFLLINGPSVLIPSAHMSTSVLDLRWPTIAVLWFILGMICHSARGLHLAMCSMCTSSAGEESRSWAASSQSCCFLSLIADHCWFSVFPGYSCLGAGQMGGSLWRLVQRLSCD